MIVMLDKLIKLRLFFCVDTSAVDSDSLARHCWDVCESRDVTNKKDDVKFCKNCFTGPVHRSEPFSRKLSLITDFLVNVVIVLIVKRENPSLIVKVGLYLDSS